MGSTKVITGKVRFSYVHVFEPTAMSEGQEPKYSVSIIIDKKDKQTIDAVKAAIEQAKLDYKAKLVDKSGKVPANLRTPLRDGDVERPDSPEYAGSLFMTASSFRKPGIIDVKRMPIDNPDDFYSGCYGKASVNFYGFAQAGNKGIACGLNNLLKLEDGERLDGGTSAAEDFADDTEDDGLI